MKTSNIILIVFFLLAFITPVLVAVALKNKIEKGQYSRVVNIHDENSRNIKTGDYKVLNISKGSSDLRCTIINDGKSYIEYDKFSDDTISFSRVADTLSIKNLQLKKREEWERNDFDVTIHTSKLSVLKAAGAGIFIQAMPDSLQSLQIFLTDSASLTFSANERSHNREYIYQRGEHIQQMTTEPEKEIRFNRLEIVANSSQVILTQNLAVETLSIDADEHSSVYFDDRFHFQNMSGRISDNTVVKGPWKTISNLKILNK